MYNIAVVERDREFISRLTAYARESVFARSLSLTGLSEPSAIEAYFSGERRPPADLIVGNRELLEAHGLYGSKMPVLTLVEDYGTSLQVEELAYKYSPAAVQLARFLRMCEAGLPRYTRTDGRECAVYSVYSAAGGCGKSTVALNIAHLFAAHNRRVCLLNLESLASFELDDPAHDADLGIDLSRLLYEATSKPDCPLEPSWFTPRPGSHWSPRRSTGMREWEELGAADTELLLRKLAKEGPFDAIVLDLESNLQPRMLASLAASHVVLWLMRNDEACARKTNALLGELQREHAPLFALLARTVKFGLNRNTGASYRFGLPGFGREEGLSFEFPYIPAWKNGATSEELLREPALQARLLPLLGLEPEGIREAG